MGRGPGASEPPITDIRADLHFGGGEEAAGAGRSLKTKKPQRVRDARASGNEITFGAEIVMSKNITNVIPFKFDKRDVRTLLIDDQPWLYAVDVCASLGLADTNKALIGLDDDEKCEHEQYSGSGRKPILINESGLYSLILRSRKAEAKRFKKWVTAEVLPTIRKHGRYEDEQDKMQPMVDGVLGKPGAQRLSNVMRCRVAKMDAADQRSATAKLASAVHACFGVPRLELIPAGQFDAAANFIASYSIEGEYLGREDQKPQGLNIHCPVEALAKRRHGMLTDGGPYKSWLDVTLDDLRDIRGEGTPCEEILWELDRAGYQVEGALCELRTYRNKLREFQSWAAGLGVMLTGPKRYAVKLGDAA